MDFAVCANLKVEIVSSMNLSSKDTVQTMMIFDFPVKEFFRIRVNTEFLNGMWVAACPDVDFLCDCYDNLLITKLKVERLLLIFAAYFSLCP